MSPEELIQYVVLLIFLLLFFGRVFLTATKSLIESIGFKKNKKPEDLDALIRQKERWIRAEFADLQPTPSEKKIQEET